MTGTRQARARPGGAGQPRPARRRPATTARRPAVRGQPAGLRRRNARTGALLVTPAFALVATFVLFPLGFAIYISLTNWPLIGQYQFTGGQNYASLAHDQAFIHSVLFTLLYTGIVTGPILAVGYGLALLVRSGRAGTVVFRTAFFLPFVVGLATESFMILLEVTPGSGAVNVVLRALGITDGNTAWIVHPGLALGLICVFVIWFASGLTMMLLMAGMQAIPADLYEAAEVDGAGWWRREWRITLPLLRRTIALSLIISVIGSLLAFNQFYILTQGGPGTSTATVVLWLYQVAFVQFHLGYATAMAIVLIVVVGLISAVQFYLLREDAGKGQPR